jgi:hypothetical protein
MKAKNPGCVHDRSTFASGKFEDIIILEIYEITVLYMNKYRSQLEI